eukprot:m.63387 g.63387  ORF g.63387 m.63387 type:complete len:210 (+) comp13844_c0_seq1:114-743(+)
MLQELHPVTARLVREDKSVDSQAFLQAFAILSSFLKTLGTVFGFVTSDVDDKLKIITAYVNKRGHATLQELVVFEVKEGLTLSGSDGMKSGSRTLLRLQRAMAFIALFVRDLVSGDASTVTSKLASTSYDATLAQHHPWLVRKAAHLAFYTLPSHEDLLVRIHGPAAKGAAPSDRAAANEIIMESVRALEEADDLIEALFRAHNLLQLP